MRRLVLGVVLFICCVLCPAVNGEPRIIPEGYNKKAWDYKNQNRLLRPLELQQQNQLLSPKYQLEAVRPLLLQNPHYSQQRLRQSKQQARQRTQGPQGKLWPLRQEWQQKLKTTSPWQKMSQEESQQNTMSDGKPTVNKISAKDLQDLENIARLLQLTSGSSYANAANVPYSSDVSPLLEVESPLQEQPSNHIIYDEGVNSKDLLEYSAHFSPGGPMNAETDADYSLDDYTAYHEEVCETRKKYVLVNETLDRHGRPVEVTGSQYIYVFQCVDECQRCKEVRRNSHCKMQSTWMKLWHRPLDASRDSDPIFEYVEVPSHCTCELLPYNYPSDCKARQQMEPSKQVASSELWD